MAWIRSPLIATTAIPTACRWIWVPLRTPIAPTQGADRQPMDRQQQAAGRDAVRPGRAGSLTQAIGTLPPPQGLAQIVGLALGAPEFQRR